MNDNLNEELRRLKKEKAILTKSLDLNYKDKEKKKELFSEIEIIREEIKKVKWKIELRRAMKNEKSR